MKSLKELSLRIKNIRSVQKTTKIMQMVSAAKLLQSQKKLSNSKLYISKLHSIVSSLVLAVDQELLAKVLNTSEESSRVIRQSGNNRATMKSITMEWRISGRHNNE